ncbi:MAG: porphobilinogen deaminase [Candelina mexicana]|nr:MAG: porphobilinogen deaminase [Candelina mexicana]
MATADGQSDDAIPSEVEIIIHIGTRKSKLALIQTAIVHEALRKAWPEFQYEIHAMSTMGDKNQVTPLHDFGAKSLWTHELEALLIEGKLDLIVHSLKDIPTQLPPSCTIGAIFPRADPRDALVMKPTLATEHSTLDSLPAGSTVGTSSVRRSAQISRKYPNLRFADVRGNVGTRLSKLDAEDGQYSCLILAAAGLQRLELGDRITQYLDSENGGILHAVGQGALGVEIREGDQKTTRLLEKLACSKTTMACLAERSLLRTLEGGCSVPIGVESRWVANEDGDGEKLLMKAVVVSLDGKESVEAEKCDRIESKGQADEFGWALARDLVEKGASKILEKITLNRGIIGGQDGA